MTGRPAMAIAARALGAAVLTVTLVAACGGGGGSANAPQGGAPSTPQVGSVAWTQASVNGVQDIFSVTRRATASLSVSAPGVSVYYDYQFDHRLVSVKAAPDSNVTALDFEINFVFDPNRAPGIHKGILYVKICYDDPCTRHLPGSPLSLPINLEVARYLDQPEQGVALLAPSETTVLDHDVTGAAYSPALDAVITASASPRPMLRVHDLASGRVRSLDLPVAPTSLSLGLDGREIALGHDGAVSLVEIGLDRLALLWTRPVPARYAQIALTSSAIVASGSQRGEWNGLYAVDKATGSVVELQRSFVQNPERVVLRAHPSGNRVYSVTDDLRRIDLPRDGSGGLVTLAPATADQFHRQGLAISPDANRIYTGLGVITQSATTLADDMRHVGVLTRSPPLPSAHQAYVLDVSPDSRRVAWLEQSYLECRPWPEDRYDYCYTRLVVHDASTLSRLSLHGLPTYQRGADVLRQWGRQLMHRSDGSLILITEVRTRDEPVPTWLMHRLAR